MSGTLLNRPEALAVNPEHIPAAMRAEPLRWSGWRFTLIDDTWKKIPYRADDPHREAKVNEPADWRSFDEALRGYRAGDFDGLGFLLGDGWAGVDLDDVREPASGELTAAARAILAELNTYGEVSPSGTGLKFFLRAWPGKNHSKAGVEVYGASRYFTVTGERV